MKPEDVKVDEHGLIPIVQDLRTRSLLTLAYMTTESPKRTPRNQGKIFLVAPR